MHEEVFNRVESIITKLSGVISAKIIFDNKDLIEIHVLTNKSRSPKQISRDIQSIYAATTGEILNHKIISIAQIDDGHSFRDMGRVILEKISFQDTFENDTYITVSTKLDGKIEEGVRFGILSKRNLFRMIVEATIDSVEKLVNIDNKIVFEDCECHVVAKENVFIVGVSMLTKTGENLLIGSAINRGNEREAVVRATLDAINRRLSTN